MLSLENLLDTIFNEGQCKCTKCSKGIIYPARKDIEAKDNNKFICNACGYCIRLGANIIVE